MNRLFFSSLMLRSFLCGLFILLAFSASTHADTLSASVDRDTISLQETLTLTLRFYAQTSDSPDLTLLQKDFDILNTQQSNQMRVINGDMESFTDWRIALAPKRVGTLEIPSFTIEGASSDAIPITVESQSRAPQNASSEVFVDVKVNKDNAYVQEQILLTIRLYTSVNLNGAEMTPLELPDALVVDLGENQYQTNINGRQHIVVERVYSIFPQHSGELIIPSLTYNVSVRSSQRDPWADPFGNRRSNLLRLRTEEQRVKVNTAPAQFTGQDWLPAKDLQLTEHWSTERLKVGEPVTRTITLSAEGLTAGQLTPLSMPAVDGLTFYPDQPQNDDKTSNKGVTGSRIETLAIIPNRSGKFTLPAISVDWWDTDSQKMKTATLPAKTVQVEDALGNITPDPVPALSVDTPAETTPITTDMPSATTDVRVVNIAPVWLITVALILGLTTLMFAWLYWQARRELRAIHSFYIAEKTQDHVTETAAWNDLKRAAANKDYPALRTALIHWAQAHWQDPQLQNLQLLAERSSNDALRVQLKKLDEILYRGAAGNDWDSSELIQEINNCRRQKHHRQKQQDGLVPLYKS
ncbi:BatD family protein [Cellvibrio sp. ARAG 10.3]|uniref:BatD family protein n=1 Tax=Cellvibrio sp. ARAG 10.3 TaxID=3451358 RepID=UPI003F46AB27